MLSAEFDLQTYLSDSLKLNIQVKIAEKQITCFAKTSLKNHYVHY